jgi:hypothetical protein
MFRLPEADEDYLNLTRFSWETIVEGGTRWLVVHGALVSPGYNVGAADRTFSIDTGYPSSQIDMVYFHPELARADGRSIGAVTATTIDGRTFQRWSRHRTALNPWRPGIDDISTHMLLVDQWLDREFNLR